jgi:hypothetical protein
LTESFVAKDGTVVRSFIYKAINAWGDSFRANEFYNAPNQSIIDNGFIPVTETEDTSIVDLFENKKDEVDNKRNQKSEIKPSGKPAINNKNNNNCG